MKVVLGCTALAVAVAITTVPADAKGCIKGAIVGGVAGHVAVHHGWLGAAASARHALLREVADDVAARTGGVPLFVEDVRRRYRVL